ncbi:MAG: hypothetical protein ABI655_06000 [Phenylobacterium sp.]
MAIAAGVIVLAPLVLYGAWMLAFILSAAPCGFEVKDQKIAPDGLRKAAVVEVNCGATTPYVTWVVVANARAPFHYEEDRVDAIVGRTGRIAWEGPKLIIFYPATRPPTVNPDHARGVEFRVL